MDGSPREKHFVLENITFVRFTYSYHTYIAGNVTGMNVDGSISNLAQFGQDTMKRVPQPNTGQGQFMHNQITIRVSIQSEMPSSNPLNSYFLTFFCGDLTAQ